MNFNDTKIEFVDTYNLFKEETDIQKKDELLIKFNELFLKLITLSKEENILFSSSTIEVYKNHLPILLKKGSENHIVFDEIIYLKKRLEIDFSIHRLSRYSVPKDPKLFYKPLLNEANHNLFKFIVKQRMSFIEEELYKRGHEVTYSYPNGDTSYSRINYVKHPSKIEEYKNSQLLKINEPVNEVFDDFNFNENLPYKIALLNEIGFFEMESIKNLTKQSQYKIISKLTGGTIRTIKGNVLVLNPNSNEDASRYTSNNYVDIVKLDLNKLK